MNRISVLTLTAMLAGAAPLVAQGKGRGNGGVPPGQRPPAGMCRIWIDGVPPGRQPAPTDCATANANRPPNARIIYGDRTRDDGRVYNRNGGVYYPSGYPNGGYPNGGYPSGSYPGGNYPNGGVYYPNGNDQNRRVVVINGRRCVQSTDSNGRVHTYCGDSYEQNATRSGRRGDDEDRDDDRDGDRRFRTSNGNANLMQSEERFKGNGKHKGKGKHGKD